MWVRGRSSWLNMVLFDRSHTTFHWSVIVSTALSCTIFKSFDVNKNLSAVLLAEAKPQQTRVTTSFGAITEIKIQTPSIHCVSKQSIPFWCLIITLADVDRFSKFFHQLIHMKILYVYTTKISTSPAVCCYTTLWNSKIEKCYQIFTLNIWYSRV